MKSDPAIDDIRRTRREISRRFGHDTKALVAHYQELQKKYADRLVAKPTRARVLSDARDEPTSQST